MSEREQSPDRTAGELDTLVAMLDWYREGVLLKVDGLGQEAATRLVVASGTTIAGLVKHLALVEDSWFTNRFAGLEEPEPWLRAPFDDDPDWEFHSAAEQPLIEVVELYRIAVARSRVAIEGHGPDDLAASRDGLGRPFNLRFVLVHLIEETARHLGHLDILREVVDGSVGE